MGPIPKAGQFPPIGAHGVSILHLSAIQNLLMPDDNCDDVNVQPFQPVVSPSPGAIAGWMSGNSPSLPHPSMAAGPPGFVQPSSAGKDVCNYIVDYFSAL